MEAAAIENENKLCVDGFWFSYFPMIWPSAIHEGEYWLVVRCYVEYRSNP